MLANTKQLEIRLNQLTLPSWFNWVKLGVPYAFAITASLIMAMVLGGGLALPQVVLEGAPMLQWITALFLAMQPALKFIAVSLMALGTFLTSFSITSIFVKGFLFNYVEKAASEGKKLSEELFEQGREFQHDIALQGEFHDREKLAFVDGFLKQNNKAKPLATGPEQNSTKQTEESASKPEPVTFSAASKLNRQPSSKSLARAPSEEDVHFEEAESPKINLSPRASAR